MANVFRSILLLVRWGFGLVDNEILWVGLRFKYHAERAGYDYVVPDGQGHVFANRLPFGGAVEGSLLRKLNFFLVDLVTCFRGVFYKKIVYYHPENTVFISPFFLKLLGKKIIFTIHLHEDLWLRRRPSSVFYWLRSKSLKCVDKIVSLSSAQAKEFAVYLGRRSAEFVPFAYNFSEYVPTLVEASHRLRLKKIVVVGSNYRDFSFLERVLESEEAAEYQFELLGMSGVIERFANYKNVIVHCRLSDEAYMQLLRQCLIMFLPLSYSSANCAIFEAYDSCLPLICTQANGVRDYVNDSDSIIGDVQDFFFRVKKWVGGSSESYLEYVIKQKTVVSQKFSWPIVRRALLEVIKEA